MLRCLTSFVVASMIIVCEPMHAQSAQSLPIGTRVRVTYRMLETESPADVPPPVVGPLVRATADSVFVRSSSAGDTLSLALRNFERLDYSARRYHPYAGSIGTAGLAGAAVGYVIGRVFFSTRATTCAGLCATGDRTLPVPTGLRYVGLGAAIGVTAGYLYARASEYDQWIGVRIPVR